MLFQVWTSVEIRNLFGLRSHTGIGDLGGAGCIFTSLGEHHCSDGVPLRLPHPGIRRSAILQNTQVTTGFVTRRTNVIITIDIKSKNSFFVARRDVQWTVVTAIFL